MKWGKCMYLGTTPWIQTQQHERSYACGPDEAMGCTAPSVHDMSSPLSRKCRKPETLGPELEAKTTT